MANNRDRNHVDEENSPLLQGNHQFPNHGTVVPRDDSDNSDRSGNHNVEPSELEEPSTWKLMLIMCSIWVGVFLGALGKDFCTRPHRSGAADNSS